MKAVPLLALFALQTGSWGPPVVLGQLQDRSIDQSSGLAASRRSPGLLWTHNDHKPELYLIDLQGRTRSVWKLPIPAFDWEDLSPGPNASLYAGDIGDNGRRRSEIVVHRFDEPALGDRQIRGLKAIRLRYPDGRHDAEALMVHPKTGVLYIVTKARGEDTETGVYKATPPFPAGLITLRKIASLTLPEENPITLVIGRVTGGSISPDGRRVALCDYLRGYEAALPPGETDFDRIWRAAWTTFDLGPRRQGESIAYSLDGNSLFATSEGVPCPLVQVKRR